MKKHSLYLSFLIGMITIMGSCTNLDEQVYDRLVDNNFYKNEKDIINISLIRLRHYNFMY